MDLNGFGTEPYSIEELTAEIGACYLMSYASILISDITNTAAYIRTWLTKLRNDKRFIVYASAQAQRAADFILNLEIVNKSEEEVAS